MNAGCVSVYYRLLRYLHIRAGYMASRSPLACFLLTVDGLAHLLMVPQKLCLRVLGAGQHMDIDCRVAPMGTQYTVSLAILSLSPQHRWDRSLNTWCPRLPCNSVLLRVTHGHISLQSSSGCQPGYGERLKNTGKLGTAELELVCSLSGQCSSIPGRVCMLEKLCSPGWPYSCDLSAYLHSA